jgi:hypothetical protein
MLDDTPQVTYLIKNEIYKFNKNLDGRKKENEGYTAITTSDLSIYSICHDDNIVRVYCVAYSDLRENGGKGRRRENIKKDKRKDLQKKKKKKKMNRKRKRETRQNSYPLLVDIVLYIL